MSILTIANSSGQALNVRVALADNPKGTVVVHHGFGGSMNSPAIVTLTKAFAQSGLHTIVPDTRNSLNSSGGDIADFTFAGHASDLSDVVKWTTAQNWCKGPLSIAGYSLGGFGAVKVAAKRDDVKSLLLVAPVFSGAFFAQGLEAEIPGIMAYWKKNKKIELATDSGQSFKMPCVCWKEWNEADALKEASHIRGNVSILTAKKDMLILPSHISAARRAFKQAAGFDAQSIPREIHAFTNFPGKLQDWAIR